MKICHYCKREITLQHINVVDTTFVEDKRHKGMYSMSIHLHFHAHCHVQWVREVHGGQRDVIHRV